MNNGNMKTLYVLELVRESDEGGPAYTRHVMATREDVLPHVRAMQDIGLVQAVNDVAAFHRATDTSVGVAPKWPSDERVALRIELIEEEVVKELLTALRARDMVGASNGIVDSIYVLIGAALEIGIPIVDEWAATQFSNMAKAVLQADGSFKVVRRADGKILKPEGWKLPDTEGILRRHGWAGAPPPVRTTFVRDRTFATRCDNCAEKETAHEWVCIGCGVTLAWAHPSFPVACACGLGATLYCPA